MASSGYDPWEERRAFLRFGGVNHVDVLDIGAGRGELSRIAAGDLGCKVTCIDPDPEKLKRAAEALRAAHVSNGVEFEVGDARQLSFHDGMFTCVACFSVLHHVPVADRERVVSEAIRVARDAVLLAEVNPAGAKHFDEVVHPGENHQAVQVEKTWLLAALKGHGAVIVEDRPHMYFVKLVKPKLNGDRKVNPDGNQETLDKFADDLQKELLGEELKEYNEYIVKLFHDPPNMGRLEGDGVLEHSYLGPCGDRMTLYLRIKDDIIKKASFHTTGCGASVATGAQTTLLVQGKNVDEASHLDAAAIDEALGGLPADHKHCAELARRTLQQALAKYRDRGEIDPGAGRVR